MKTYLSVDQSFTATGWTVCKGNSESITMLDCGCITTDKDKPIYERALEIADALLDVYEEYEPDGFIIEQLAFGAMGNATRNLAGLLFVIITSLIRRNGLDCEKDITFVTPTSAKKCFTGSGKASKSDMWNHCPKKVIDSITAKGYLKSKGGYDVVDAYSFSYYKFMMG